MDIRKYFQWAISNKDDPKMVTEYQMEKWALEFNT